MERNRYTPPAPIKEGETHEVEIEDIGKEGDGIAKIKGFVIFVPKTKVGDKVTVRIEAVRRAVGFAKKVE